MAVMGLLQRPLFHGIGSNYIVIVRSRLGFSSRVASWGAIAREWLRRAQRAMWKYREDVRVKAAVSPWEISCSIISPSTSAYHSVSERCAVSLPGSAVQSFRGRAIGRWNEAETNGVFATSASRYRGRGARASLIRKG